MPWDFRLWEWRKGTGASWDVARATPPWRVQRDLAYMQIEARARAWHVQEAENERSAQEAKRRVRAMAGR